MQIVPSLLPHGWEMSEGDPGSSGSLAHIVHISLFGLLGNPADLGEPRRPGKLHEGSQQRVPRHHPTFITRGDRESQEPPRTDAVVCSGAAGSFPIFSYLLVLSGTHAMSQSSAYDCTIIPAQKTN